MQSTEPKPSGLATGITVIVVALYMAVAAGVVALELMPGHTTRFSQITNPLGVPSLAPFLRDVQNVSILPGLAVLIGIIASLVVRFRRSRGPERQQLKWFFFSGLLIPVTFLLNGTPLGEVAYLTILPLVALSIGISVLKYRLYDIDVVISRTLVYGALAAFITAVYVGIVVGIGTLVGSGGKPNLVLSIVATAVVAVAFQPVRERLQKIANRLVYGERATPYEGVVAILRARRRNLRRGGRPAKDGACPCRGHRCGAGDRLAAHGRGKLRPAAAWPIPILVNGNSPDAADGPAVIKCADLPTIENADRVIPVRHQGELLGALSVTKRAGESLAPMEDKLLDDLAHQAGLVLKNVGLAAELLQRVEELRASRQRLVTAQDDERRRLERNLHDGAQQNLVALKVKLGLAEMMAEKDPAGAKELVRELKADADDALETLRDMARGIYPPLLADKGLAAALESQARKATLPVEVDADAVGRYPQDIEAAVYFCVLEALPTVQKYAAATTVTVRLRREDGELRFEVEDDGAGFHAASARKGSGLTNMEDRLDALGGGVVVDSSPGQGTRLRGHVPVLVGATSP